MGETHAQRRYIQDHCRNVLTSATYPFGKGDDKITISKGSNPKVVLPYSRTDDRAV